MGLVVASVERAGNHDRTSVNVYRGHVGYLARFTRVGKRKDDGAARYTVESTGATAHVGVEARVWWRLVDVRVVAAGGRYQGFQVETIAPLARFRPVDLEVVRALSDVAVELEPVGEADASEQRVNWIGEAPATRHAPLFRDCWFRDFAEFIDAVTVNVKAAVKEET